jgi:hypothetical protein
MSGDDSGLLQRLDEALAESRKLRVRLALLQRQLTAYPTSVIGDAQDAALSWSSESEPALVAPQ